MKKILSIVLSMVLLNSCFGVLSVSAEEKITITINGAIQSYDVSPVIVDGRTLVPMRAIFESLGAEVEWNEKTRTIKATAGNTVITLGIGVTMTAIFTPAQALLAAAAGADFVAPYVNRLDNIIGDGCDVAAEIVKQLTHYGYDCKVLVASFKNAEQVHRCASVGCHSVTVSRDILETVISHPMTDAAIQGFEKDWEELYGDKSILDF